MRETPHLTHKQAPLSPHLDSLDSATTILPQNQENGRCSFDRHTAFHLMLACVVWEERCPTQLLENSKSVGSFLRVQQATPSRLSFLMRDSLTALNYRPLWSLTPILMHWLIRRNKSHLDAGVHPEQCLLSPNTETDPVLLRSWVRGFFPQSFLWASQKNVGKGSPHGSLTRYPGEC